MLHMLLRHWPCFASYHFPVFVCGFLDRRRSRRKSNKSSMAEISEIMTGHELYEIFESAYDPGSLQVSSFCNLMRFTSSRCA